MVFFDITALVNYSEMSANRTTIYGYEGKLKDIAKKGSNISITDAANKHIKQIDCNIFN